jgi:ribosomal peptide maturation radical SAM protein 1
VYSITLINMPFANLASPSIALTQLKQVLDAELEGQVSVDILYLNHDFARYLGRDLYSYMMGSSDSQDSGLGDWFFRQVAFPDLISNAGAYFTRYFPYRTDKMNDLKRLLLDKRRGLDAFMNQVVSDYDLGQAGLVGFTSMFMQNVASFAMARKVKERNQKVVTMMGGANCESPMGQIIAKRVDQIDYVFSGPGLKTLPRFVRSLLNGEIERCDSINGVFSKRSYLFQSGPEAIGEEMSIDSPIPLDYRPFLSRLETSFPNKEIKPILPFETSRGCWWGERAHCTFCGLNGLSMAYRAMAPELALKQFDSLFSFAPTVSKIEAVDNILPKSYLREVLPLINTPESMSIFYEVKADLSEQDVQVLAKARVQSIQPGIESLATSTLKLMRKGTSSFQNLVLLKYCLMYGVKPAWNLLIGFPGEGADVYRKYVNDLPLLVHLPPPTGVYPVRFDRYSPYFVKADEYGLDLHPLDFYSLVYPFSEDELSNLAYYFADVNANAEYAQTMSKWIDSIREKMDRWIGLWKGWGQQSRPKLYFKGDSDEIYDSRDGKAIEYRVGETGKKILDLISKRPRRLGDLTKALADIEAIDPPKEVQSLQEKGLVFQENDQFLSLVVNGNEPAEAAR